MRVLCGMFVGLTLLCGTAAADCPPLQAIAGFVSLGDSEIKALDRVAMRSDRDAVDGYATIEGKVCRQSYHVADGQPTPDDAAMQAAYRAQLANLHAETVFSGDGQITARMQGSAGERWMVVYSQPGEIAVVVVDAQPRTQTLTAPSGHDYRLIGHMPAYVADAPEITENGKFDFHVEDPAGDNDVPVSGRAIHVVYRLAAGAKDASDVEIAGNYRQRFKELGAQFLSLKSDARTVARIDENGRAIWFSVYSQPGEISLYVVEEKPVQAKAENVAAGTLRQSLAANGRVALYINFDFNKATLKPDAAAVIAEVVALLQADAGLSLMVEGHTDSVGTREYNAKLSAQRAAAVVQALVAKGIAAGRLDSAGLGASKPLAGNETADGRARNRRVELVKR